MRGTRWRQRTSTPPSVPEEGRKGRPAISIDLVLEAFGDALPELAAATKIWRRMFSSEEQLARDGATFIRKQCSASAAAPV
jgi:hypothetical protein